MQKRKKPLRKRNGNDALTIVATIAGVVSALSGLIQIILDLLGK